MKYKIKATFCVHCLERVEGHHNECNSCHSSDVIHFNQWSSNEPEQSENLISTFDFQTDIKEREENIFKTLRKIRGDAQAG